MAKEINTFIESKVPIPLVTFALFAYNQARYIHEAVLSALEQTYENLEIIFSDDCSSDGTFDSVKEIVDAYNGPHPVILNRNEKNLGIGCHVSKVMNMANGELVVMAAGDDVSLPKRTEKLTKKWCEVGRPSGICSEVIVINDAGKIISGGEDKLHFCGMRKGMISPEFIIDAYLKNERYWLTGCSTAWSKKTWDRYGGMGPHAGNEDMVMSFRAGLHNGFYIMTDQLVHYRKHEENTSFATKTLPKRSFGQDTLPAIKHVDRLYHLLLVNKMDLETANNNMSSTIIQKDRLQAHIDQQLAKLRVAKRWWDYSFFGKICFWSSSPFESIHLRLLSMLGERFYRIIQHGVYQLRCFLHTSSRMR